MCMYEHNPEENKSVEIEIRPFVHVKKVTYYHIPTYDEVIKEGTALGIEAALHSAGDEIIDLLDSEEGKCLAIEDYNKIKDLITHDGVPINYAGCIYSRLVGLCEDFKYKPIHVEYEKFIDSMADWARNKRL